MDKFKKILLFLLEPEVRTDPRALKNQEISKMVNMKKSMVHTNLKYQQGSNPTYQTKLNVVTFLLTLSLDWSAQMRCNKKNHDNEYLV